MDPEQRPNKRRRLDAADALARPFKSPLRRAEPTGDSSEDPSPQTSETGAKTAEAVPAPAKPTVEPTAEPAAETATESAIKATGHHDPADSSTETVRIFLRCATPDDAPPRPVARPWPAPVDTEMQDLQRQRRRLQSRAEILRTEHHSICQARSIHFNNKDAQLEELIRKWRRAGQKAAEEVLENSRRRIAQQGGFEAFKERTKSSMQRELYDDLEPGEVEDLQRETAAQGTMRDKMPRDEDDELTMKYLLRVLEIPADVIGLDEATGDWM